jgi:serine/threonine-protein kinase RsbW
MAEGVLREVTLSLDMAPDMELEASKTSSAIAESIRMSPDRIDEVSQAVIEACINALEHSHAEDRQVWVTFQIVGQGGVPEKLRILVRDNGIGFLPDDMMPPKKPTRGHGLKIIRGMMDEVEILSGAQGTTIVMSKMLR